MKFSKFQYFYYYLSNTGGPLYLKKFKISSCDSRFIQTMQTIEKFIFSKVQNIYIDVVKQISFIFDKNQYNLLEKFRFEIINRLFESGIKYSENVIYISISIY